MVKSTASRRPKKASHTGTHPDFPLTRHPRGYWCKKVKGKLAYFGKIATDPDGQAALAEWLRVKDYLLAGKTPPRTGDGLTILTLVNTFLTSKKRMVESGELSERTFHQYHATCAIIVEVLGKSRLVSDLAADDYETLRAAFAKGRGPVALSNEITVARMLFKYAYDQALVDVPPRYGQSLNKPSRKTLRVDRAAKGQRMFEAAELQRILEAAGMPMRLFVLLGLNCAYGSSDIAGLPITAIDLDSGLIAYARGKTGIPRRCSLWPETITALREAIDSRPTPKDDQDADLAFLTARGNRWVRSYVKDKTKGATPDDEIGKEFSKLLVKLKLNRKGLGFYALRHTFRTVADECGDFPAIDLVMGHSDPSMAGVYRERIGDSRLKAVADHVRAWLFGVADDHQQAPAADDSPRLRVVGAG